MFKEKTKSKAIIKIVDKSLVKKDDVIILKELSFKAKPKILSGLEAPVLQATIIPVKKSKKQKIISKMLLILFILILSIRKDFIGENCRNLFFIYLMYESNKKKEQKKATISRFY